MDMDDKERIEYIILEKQLSDGDFCAKAGISPAALSHIKSGRSKPSLTILRSVVSGFPELNPEWVMLGTGEMYRATVSGEESETDGGRTSQVESSSTNDNVDMFAGMTDIFATSAATQPTKAAERGHQSVVAQRQQMAERAELTKQHVAEVVRETLTQVQKPPRKIVEVRIFFDDGTYETFN